MATECPACGKQNTQDDVCGVDFLDAKRLAVATGPCDADPQIVLFDVTTGKSRELDGDKGHNLAFEPD